jgi:hypothetical protein
MSLKKIIPTLFLIIATSSVIAGSFDGPFAQVGAGFAYLGSNASVTRTPNPYTESYKGGETGVMGNVALGYSYELPQSFNIAANVFYNFGSQNAGQYNYQNSTTYTYQSSLKNIWGISVEPGFNFSDKSLGFLKLGWASATASVTSSGSGAGYNGALPPGTYSGTSNGFLYGLGFKQLLTENIFIGVEAYQVAFSTVTQSSSSAYYGNVTGSQKPSLTYGGINLGYKF